MFKGGKKEKEIILSGLFLLVYYSFREMYWAMGLSQRNLADGEVWNKIEALFRICLISLAYSL
jgi:hypothetical protein